MTALDTRLYNTKINAAIEAILAHKIRINRTIQTAIIADIVTKLWQTPHTQYHIDLIPNVSFVNILYAILTGIFLLQKQGI